MAAGEARTNAAGRATRRIQRVLSPGKHTVVAAWLGRSDLQPARASLELTMDATLLTLQFDRARSHGGMRAPIVARLTDTTGAPVMCLERSVFATSSTGVSSRNEITFRVITSLTGIIEPAV